jgi:hypothetical protein
VVPDGVLLLIGCPDIEDSAKIGRGNPTMAAYHDVLENGEVLEQSNILKGSSNACVGDEMGRGAADDRALEYEFPIESSIHSGDEIKQSRLPGAIGPDHSENRSFLNVKVHLLQGLEAPESFADASTLQNEIFCGIHPQNRLPFMSMLRIPLSPFHSAVDNTQ